MQCFYDFHALFPMGSATVKRHITWVLGVLLFPEEFQMEPLTPNVICYHTSPGEVLDQIG